MRHSLPSELAVVLLVSVILLSAGGVRSAGSNEFVKPPTGISEEIWSYFIPRDNPLTPAKVELGRQLFFDQRLSVDNSVSCATCHDPRFAFADGKKTAVGIGGRRGARNTPSVLNAMFNSTLFWDGRAESLESQTHEPLINPDEMGNASHEQSSTGSQLFRSTPLSSEKSFGGPVNVDSLGKAIAAYGTNTRIGKRTVDRFFGRQQKRFERSGTTSLTLFRTKARCSVCHN